MKIIEVDISKRLQGYDHEKQQEVLNLFGMPIPDAARLTLCDSTVAKMLKAEALVKSREFHRIEFLSTTKADFEHCEAELLINQHVIPISHYDDFDRYFYTFDRHHFTVIADASSSNAFRVEFIYTHGSCAEFVFKTKNFSL